MSTHLKPEQMNDLLLGIADSATSAHLNSCPHCRAEIAAVRRSLTSFRDAAITWSEAASKPVSLQSRHRVRPPWARPAWAFAAIAILFAVAIPLSVWRGHGDKPDSASDAQAQISRDNQLLAHIDSEVDETTPTPMQPLQVNPK